ncbi:Type I secretion outer membrane protein, TolC precursor [hydrothermal vent metagenome]|uniref:Type I secretion outer membrane protein, TolC n=1 Tax=hydrothermal vent metagenome TaxID=652676 RepID=A0A3B0WNX2_9ZZZZ
MKKAIIGILFATGLLCNLQTHAQDTTNLQLNFSQALDLAIIHDQDLQAAEFLYQSELATRGLSFGALLPQINFTTSTSRTEQNIPITARDRANAATFAINNPTAPAILLNPDSSFSTNRFALTLNQTLYNHKLYKQLEQTDIRIASATATIESERQNLIVRLADAYFNVLGAQDNVKFANAEKEAIEKQLEQSKKRFEVGLIAITDVKETQASFDTSVSQAINAQNVLASQLEALSIILGTYNPRISPMINSIELTLPQPADITQWTDNALNNNLALKAATFNFQATQAQVKVDKSDHYPFLNLTAEHRNDNSKGGRFGGVDITSTSLTLQLTIPIYSGGSINTKIKQSLLLKERARAIKEKTRRQTLQQTRDAYLGISSTIAQVNALKQALTSTQIAHEATQAGFEVGTRTAIDVLATLREVYRAERDYARARYNYIINTLKLKQATGTLNISDGQDVNHFLQN